jgi:hypothetical protein
MSNILKIKSPMIIFFSACFSIANSHYFYLHDLRKDLNGIEIVLPLTINSMTTSSKNAMEILFLHFINLWSKSHELFLKYSFIN